MTVVSVSIVLPTYDRLPLLEQAIESVRTQVFQDWELVVVDDGSRDGTREYIGSLADPRLRPVRLQHGGNVARVRNAGLREARGRLIAFLDSDDLWRPRKLAVQVDHMRNRGLRWSYTGYTLIDDDGRDVPPQAGRWKALAGKIVEPILTTEVGVAISTLMVERSLLDEVGYFNEDPALHLREDYELVLRLAMAAEAGAIDEFLVRVREHAGRSTHGRTDLFERSARVYETFMRTCDDEGLRRIAGRRRGYHLAEAAAEHLRSGRYAVAAQHYIDSLKSGVGIRPWLSALKRGGLGRLNR